MSEKETIESALKPKWWICLATSIVGAVVGVAVASQTGLFHSAVTVTYPQVQIAQSRDVYITPEGPKPNHVYVIPPTIDDMHPGDTVVFRNLFPTQQAKVTFPNGSPFTDQGPFVVLPENEDSDGTSKVIRSDVDGTFEFKISVPDHTDASPKIIIGPSSQTSQDGTP